MFLSSKVQAVVYLNKLPRLPPDDGGIWRRILLTKFKSKFPANDLDVPCTWKEQLEKRVFLRDRTLTTKIPAMRQAMMWIMFQCFKRVQQRKTQLPLPTEVLSAIDLYRRDNDTYLQFVNERLKRDPVASISLSEFYAGFSAWYRESFGKNSVPSKTDCRTVMIGHWGEMVNGRWNGWRAKTLEDDVAEGNSAVVLMESSE